MPRIQRGDDVTDKDAVSTRALRASVSARQQGKYHRESVDSLHLYSNKLQRTSTRRNPSQVRVSQTVGSLGRNPTRSCYPSLEWCLLSTRKGVACSCTAQASKETAGEAVDCAASSTLGRQGFGAPAQPSFSRSTTPPFIPRLNLGAVGAPQAPTPPVIPKLSLSKSSSAPAPAPEPHEIEQVQAEIQVSMFLVTAPH